MTQVESPQVDVTPDGTRASTHFKGFQYDDFGRSETLRHYKLCRILEAGRFLAMKKGGFLHYPDIVDSNYGMFSLAQHYKFHPALWAVRRGTSFPYKVETQIVDIGRSSMTLESRLINKLDLKELATVIFKYVYVHRATSRSSPFPDWMLQKYTSALRERRPMTIPKNVPRVSASAYSYDVSVAESDTDHNGHTNQASYVRYCCDATHAAVQEGRLPRLEPDVCRFPLMELQTVYLGQSWMSDKLHVLLWQREDCRDTILYVIGRKQNGRETVIFHASMTFGKASVFSSHL